MEELAILPRRHHQVHPAPMAKGELPTHDVRGWFRALRSTVF